MTLRILQLTDLHLGPRLGDRRWRAFERRLADLPRRVGAFDRIVLTGDLASRGRSSIYAALRTCLSPWLDRLRVIPGNHDDRRLLREAFGDRMLPGGPGANFADELPGVRLLGLDTSRPWRVSGKLGRAQLLWLSEQLDSGVPSLIFMHHPPLPVGTWWLDKDRLRDSAGFAQRIEGRGVLAVFCGHVHQAHQGTLGSVPVWTTPSTAYQFEPGSLIPWTRPAPPGFRRIEVSDGAVETSVFDWPSAAHPPLAGR